jgi:hypothetical protein
MDWELKIESHFVCMRYTCFVVTEKGDTEVCFCNYEKHILYYPPKVILNLRLSDVDW